MLRVLHLSDIHFGQEIKGQLIHHEDVRKQLVADLKVLLGESKSLSLILINGDIAYSGKRAEYDSAVAWLDKLIAVGRCDETAVLTVPGNHDVDLDLISLAAKGVHTLLRNTEPRIVKDLLHEYTVERDAKYIPSTAASLFSFWNWDKGAELREALVDKALAGRWPAGNIALAVHDFGLLRKILKRIDRKRGKQGFAREMYSDLASRNDGQSRVLAKNLSDLLRNPEYEEDWD